MTESEAIKKLRAYCKCQILQAKGIYEDCNEELCDNCDLCYAQGNVGEHIESIEIAIQALEKQIPKKPIIQKTDEKSLYKCPCCTKIFVEAYENTQRGYIPKFCEMCGQSINFRLGR